MQEQEVKTKKETTNNEINVDAIINEIEEEQKSKFERKNLSKNPSNKGRHHKN